MLCFQYKIKTRLKNNSQLKKDCTSHYKSNTFKGRPTFRDHQNNAIHLLKRWKHTLGNPLQNWIKFQNHVSHHFFNQNLHDKDASARSKCDTLNCYLVELRKNNESFEKVKCFSYCTLHMIMKEHYTQAQLSVLDEKLLWRLDVTSWSENAFAW